MLNIQQLLANGVSPEALRNLQNGDAVGFGGAPASGTGPNIKANMAPPANFWSEASEPGGNPQFNMGAPGLQETQPGQTPTAPPPQQQPPQQQPPQAQPQQGNPAPIIGQRTYKTIQTLLRRTIPTLAGCATD